MLAYRIFFIVIFSFILSCGKKEKPAPIIQGHPKPYKIGNEYYQPIPDAKGFYERGIASWYGNDFHGKMTANGEIYDMYAMTAAHKTLPLGTFVKVKNLNSNKEIVVRINDRGPFVRGRVIDLSYNAAKQLGISDTGLAEVEVVALKTSAFETIDYNRGVFSIQVGAFLDRNNAEKLKNELNKKYVNTHIASFFDGRKTFYRVRVGKFFNLKQSERNENILIADGFKDAFTVAE
ncbi:MAG: septal ring lytic transglycosylase RlpA family protein [Desulfobacterales bacterium]|nr:septal ring lytic transglycosylase RlpA family protein [Desulfobacterales bacterium]MBF0395924.1 septal ring lytic transglycosylase RlpA family protein [Desulfobacterales bacterium]